MTANIEEQALAVLAKNLMSKWWRINNLYHIRDKDGVRMILKCNYAQTNVLKKYKHNKKIILKSRQQGISTLYVAYLLDDCLFKDGFMAGIQSYGRDESAKLSKRALFMWTELDPLIKEYLGVTLATSNSNGLSFSNGSELKVGNFRGDTLQSLHVSELAKISIKYPDKARELKTGAFQAVSINSKISIETTAEGDTGLFVDIWKKAKAVELSGRPLTPLDFQPIFLPWIYDPDCNLTYDVPRTTEVDKHLEHVMPMMAEELSINLIVDERSNSKKLFNEDYSEDNEDLVLTTTQRNWLESKFDELGDDFNQEYPATPQLAFSSSVQGTYFGHQLKRIRKENRIGDYPYNPKYPVYTSYDLGVNDEMVLLYAQVYESKIFIIGEYHNSGYGIPHYVEHTKSLPYHKYTFTILPHDVEVTEMSTGRTRRSKFIELGVRKLKVLPRLSFQESIEVGRDLLDSPNTFIHYDCINLISALQNYRKKYDAKLDAFMSIDVHDIHSNYGASLRYLGQGLSKSIVRRTSHIVKRRDLAISSNSTKTAI